MVCNGLVHQLIPSTQRRPDAQVRREGFASKKSFFMDLLVLVLGK